MPVCEHVPALLGKGSTKFINGTMVSRLVDGDYHIKTDEAVTVLHRIPINLRLLYITEAIWISSIKSN